jgi:hypothetical protein
MALRLDSEKIGGLGLPPFINIIQHCIALCATKAISLPRYWRLLLQMCRSIGICLRLIDWNTLLLCLANIHLQTGHDEFHWNLHENDKFSIASMYNALIQPDLPSDKISNNKLWRLKIPLRIKVFGWYLRKGVILTKDNLAKQNWHGGRKCVFCHQDEIIKHLFFQYRFVRSI